ncbi:MAG TPA: DUF4307 domain-containing protein [Actinomycetes bacterium]|nr:DUF4307 domain-containing protein [Actinomycetes bacterium]
MPASGQSRGRPADRYGEAGRRPPKALVAGLVVLATAFVGWVVWAALGAADPGPAGEVSGFRVVSDERIDVRVRLAAGTDEPLGCTVQALDRTREVVGVAGVELGPKRPERWVQVRTRERAVTATLGRCLAG